MKRLSYLTALALLLCSFCACGGKDGGFKNKSDADTENSDNFSGEMIIEDSGNFSTEMIIEPSTDITIIEMQ